MIRRNVSMDLNGKITANFSWHEHISPDMELKIHPLTFLMYEKLQILRNIIGAITINSGYRSTYWNNRLITLKYPASKNSKHMDGIAVDIAWNNKEFSIETVKVIAEALGFYVLAYDWGLHLDMRNYL